MGKVTGIGESSPSNLWKPADILRDTLRRIENGDINPESMAIHWYSCPEDGLTQPGQSLSNLTHEAHISMLTCTLHAAVEDLMNP